MIRRLSVIHHGDRIGGRLLGAYSDPDRRYMLDPRTALRCSRFRSATLLMGRHGARRASALHIEHAVRRHSVTEAQTGQQLVMTSPDQVVARADSLTARLQLCTIEAATSVD